MSGGTNNKYTSFNNYVATVLLASCSFVLVGILYLHSCNYSKEAKLPDKISIDIKADSTIANDEQICKDLSDSLTRIVTEHEQVLARHYDKILEEKENDNQLLSLGGIVVGIIISILGFFGFKSFQSIEEKANNTAEEKARQIAKVSIQNYIDENLQDDLEKVIRKKFHNSIVETLRSELNNKFTEKFDKLDNLETSVQSLENSRDDHDKKIHRIFEKINMETSMNSDDSYVAEANNESEQNQNSESQNMLENPFNEE